MWTYDKALAVARAYVDSLTDGQGVVLEQSVIDLPYGWVFFYQNREFVETGNPSSQFAGNAPIIFNGVSGEYRVTGTAHAIQHYLREYESTLPSYMLEMKPQLRRRSDAG
jgi:hypothetical protein